MYCVNKYNRIVYVPEDFAASQIKRGIFRKATADEIETYNLEKQRKATAGSDYSIYFQTVEKRPDGYGMSQHNIQQEMYRLGKNLSEHFQGQKIGLLYGYPKGIAAIKTPVRLIFTMFESDKIPSEWKDYLTAADEVIVPSKFCHDTFKNSGIDTTIVPLGYNARVFSYIDREIPVEHGRPFTFIHYDSFNIRKGFAEVVNAFNSEFKNNEPVKLILKTVKEHLPFSFLPSQYPNIEVIQQKMTEEELSELLGRANCMVYPSRGEGFGITPLEAMATGIPAIVPNAHGISEYFNKNYMLEVSYKQTKAVYRKFKGKNLGKMVVCDEKDLRRQMRYAYDHQEEMKELGKRASEYVKAFTYEHTAKRLHDIIKKWELVDVKRRKDEIFLTVEEV